jgi:hypothetical protein
MRVDIDAYPVPFGKYKDLTVHEMMVRDPAYVGWLINNNQIVTSPRTRKLALQAYQRKLKFLEKEL